MLMSNSAIPVQSHLKHQETAKCSCCILCVQKHFSWHDGGAKVLVQSGDIPHTVIEDFPVHAIYHIESLVYTCGNKQII